jgi:quercetin dioxygenase-like cupin family protein
MHRIVRLGGFLVLFAAAPLISTSAAAPPDPQPVTLPCATNVSAQVLGNAAPGNAAGQGLVLARIIFGPGGSIGPHTHPGTLVVSVESGTLGFTLIDEGEMAVMRAAPAGTPAAAEPLVVGQEVELAPGDWFVETGMVHTARSVGDEPASVLLSGLIEAGQPLTRCVEGTPTP